jgi:hypothetical protein
MITAALQVVAGQSYGLVAIKAAHTVIWAFFVACILALPIAAWRRRFRFAAILSALVLLECGVLALNHGQCPLTGLAANFTADRSPNFDIYLPAWLARNNKVVFGSLFLASELLVVLRWLLRED